MTRYGSQGEIAEFLERRLHGVKLAANLLLKELTGSRDSVILTRKATEAIFYTIDTFVEDAEKLLAAKGRGGAYREVPMQGDAEPAYRKPTRPLRDVTPLK